MAGDLKFSPHRPSNEACGLIPVLADTWVDQDPPRVTAKRLTSRRAVGAAGPA